VVLGGDESHEYGIILQAERGGGGVGGRERESRIGKDPQQMGTCSS
jgi:hypothetical protein